MAKDLVTIDIKTLADLVKRAKPHAKKKKRFKSKDLHANSISGLRKRKAEYKGEYALRRYGEPIPYRQQVLYATGDFNRSGDRYDVGIQAEKSLSKLRDDYHDATRQAIKNSVGRKNEPVDIDAEPLPSMRHVFSPSFTQEEDIFPLQSTSPLTDAPPAPKIKRTYVKSGKYSKKRVDAYGNDISGLSKQFQNKMLAELSSYQNKLLAEQSPLIRRPDAEDI